MLYFGNTPKGSSSKSTGRDILHAAAVNCLVVAATAWLCMGHVQAARSADNSSLVPLNRFPRMVQEYFVESTGRIEERADRRWGALKTKADAEAYIGDVREKIQQSFGPWPQKTPLKPRITGVIERDAYRIEKVIFESRPEFLVTANLYIPKGLRVSTARRRGNLRSFFKRQGGRSIPILRTGTGTTGLRGFAL